MQGTDAEENCCLGPEPLYACIVCVYMQQGRPLSCTVETTSCSRCITAVFVAACYLDCLGLRPHHPGVPQHTDHSVVHNTVRPAVVVLHLIKGIKGSPPLAPLFIGQNEASICHRVRLAALGLHLVKQLHCLLPLCPCVMTYTAAEACPVSSLVPGTPGVGGEWDLAKSDPLVCIIQHCVAKMWP